MFRVDDKQAVVVGGAGYLGSSVCRLLAAQGATVLIVDINADGARSLASQLGGNHQALPFDLQEEDACPQLIQQVERYAGSLDILINATYAPHGESADTISIDAFTNSMRLNVATTYALAREAKRLMSGGGSIVLFSSMYGSVSPDPRVYHRPMQPNPIEYGVAKAGIEQMIRYLAVAWAPDGIRVNGVAPGPFPHPGTQQQEADFVERLAQKVPMGRIGRQDEVAGAVVFLASSAASYITGQTIAIDGGWTCW